MIGDIIEIERAKESLNNFGVVDMTSATPEANSSILKETTRSAAPALRPSKSRLTKWLGLPLRRRDG